MASTSTAKTTRKRSATAVSRTKKNRAKASAKTNTKSAPKAPLAEPARPEQEITIPVSVPATPPESLMNRAAMLERASHWAGELERQGLLKPDSALLAPKEVYCSTGIGDFTKVATWAQWYGVEVFSDLSNIDRKRFALLTIEQYLDGYNFVYGLLHRDTGRIRHLFNLEVAQVGPRMRKQGLKIPNWFDVADLDHYRVG